MTTRSRIRPVEGPPLQSRRGRRRWQMSRARPLIVNGHMKFENGPPRAPLCGVRIDHRQHRRSHAARTHARHHAKSRLPRPPRDVDRRNQISALSVDHVPLRAAECRSVNRSAVGRQREAIAAMAVVGSLPDDFLGNQIERRKALDRADEQTPGLRVRCDAADALGLLSFWDRPCRDALDEFVFVVDIEDEDADALILDQTSTQVPATYNSRRGAGP